jgi:DNA-binding transcriptional ArsR family regulator
VARLRLLERLGAGEQCVCDLIDELESSQSLPSFDLKTLTDAVIARVRAMEEEQWRTTTSKRS